ncbi:unnamed protein product [Auanema sp. JU1783]|nr:unnamed protein product [Auanema sp. JU1783]
MAQNMYRVGDCVYFEDSNAGPYNIRRIEELTKSGTGGNAVEARVTVFYRRRDISAALLKIADQAERRFDEYLEEDKADSESMDIPGQNAGANAKDSDGSEGKENREDDTSFDWGYAGLPTGAEKLSKADRYKLRLRELFLSRQIETLPASQIRGKCSVSLLSDIENPESYDREDAYFYSLVYDPSQMSLLADKGAIRVGEKYQAEVAAFNPALTETKQEPEDTKENEDLMIAEEEETDDDTKKDAAKGAIDETEREILVYHPHHNLTEREIDQFLIVARAVGTFSRALDTSSSTKLPSLHMTAAAASRDVTIFHAMALLHQANYNLAEGMKFLVPPPVKEEYPLDVDKATGHNTISLGGPILIRDQIEEWSAAEANLFEEALEKYGKDFSDIRNDFLPWKGMRDIVEYYYMWKTTNRYIDGRHKRIVEEKESKLKQVYIPSHNKPCANLIGQLNTTNVLVGGSVCEGCKAKESVNWFAWGPAQLQLRLCHTCWNHWKRSGGLPFKHSCDRYDLEGGTDISAVESKVTQISANSVTSVNPLVINKTSAAAQNRVVGTGQIVARLPPSAQVHLNSAVNSLTKPGSSLKTTTPPPKSSSDKSSLPRAAPFNLKASLYTRVARRLTPKSVLNIRKQARNPHLEIDVAIVADYVASIDVRKIIDAAKVITNSRIPPAFTNFLKDRSSLVKTDITTTDVNK